MNRKKYSAWLRITTRRLFHWLGNVLPKLLSATWEYETIPLKVYVRISNEKNIRLLVKKGFYFKGYCLKKWETILKANEKATGSNRFSIYQINMKQYVLFMSNYLMIKAALSHLCFKPDQKLINFLKEKGYHIDTSSSKKYRETLFAAMNKSESIATQVLVKRNEIMKFTQDDSKLNFAEMIAGLSMALGFQVNPDITLAEYNGYLNYLKQKNNYSRERNQKTRPVQ